MRDQWLHGRLSAQISRSLVILPTEHAAPPTIDTTCKFSADSQLSGYVQRHQLHILAYDPQRHLALSIIWLHSAPYIIYPNPCSATYQIFENMHCHLPVLQEHAAPPTSSPRTWRKSVLVVVLLVTSEKMHTSRQSTKMVSFGGSSKMSLRTRPTSFERPDLYNIRRYITQDTETMTNTIYMQTWFVYDGLAG